MRTAMTVMLSLGMALALVAAGHTAQAKDKKEVTLKGTITCAKCDLKIVKGKCVTVIKVKDTIYYFDDASHKKYHKDICQEGKEGTVTGNVTEEKDGKKIIKVNKLEYAK